MMITPNLNDGETFVAGRSEETARKLFELANKSGIDTAKISTASHGYVVPSELADQLEGAELTQVGHLPAVRTEPGTTTEPKEAWNAEAWKAEQEEIQSTAAKADAENESGEFDPTAHTVEQVKEYLETADEAERERVLAAEEASDKPRRGIVKLADEEEGDK